MRGSCQLWALPWAILFRPFGASGACVAAGLFGLDQGGILAILAEYNTRCDPPWSERDLRHKAEDALRKASCPPTILE